MSSAEERSDSKIQDLREWLASNDQTDERTRRTLSHLVESADLSQTDGLTEVQFRRLESRLFTPTNAPTRFSRLVFISVLFAVVSISSALVIAREGFFSFKFGNIVAPGDGEGDPIPAEIIRAKRSPPKVHPEHPAVVSEAESVSPNNAAVAEIPATVPHAANPVFPDEDKTAPAKAMVARQRHRAVVASAPVAPPTPPANVRREGNLGAESDMVETAMRLVRNEKDPQAALLALDAYDRAFPVGILRNESRFIRVETLLLLDRKAEALQVLDTMPLDSGGRESELLLLRGELRSPGDCSAAIVDFSSLLGRAARDVFHERALFGRGVCFRALGKSAESDRDFQEYLRRYPDGKFVNAIRAAE